MKNTTCFSLLAAGLFLGFQAPAYSQAPSQNPTGTDTDSGSDDDGASQQDGIKGFWEIVLPGGRFVARLDQISSVSQHEYLVDGAGRAFEVTVDTTGPMTARFYYLEMATDGSPLSIGKNALDRVRELTREAGTRTGVGDVEMQVVKFLPQTTHAKTAEYRIRSREILDKIYEHVHKVWAEERGRGQKNKITIR